MRLRKLEIVNLIVVLSSLVVAYTYYPKLPDMVASHWNTLGEVDGYVSQFWGSFMLPAVLLGIWILFILIPRIDPKKNNINKFRNEFDGFIFLLNLLFYYLYILTLFWNLGTEFNFSVYIIPAFSVLFFYIAYMVSRAKQNYSIGIRTPWTLESKEVWEKTHKLAAKLYCVAAVISLAGVFFPDYAIWIFLVPILSASFASFIYSYIIYKKMEK